MALTFGFGSTERPVDDGSTARGALRQPADVPSSAGLAPRSHGQLATRGDVGAEDPTDSRTRCEPVVSPFTNGKHGDTLRNSVDLGDAAARRLCAIPLDLAGSGVLAWVDTRLPPAHRIPHSGHVTYLFVAWPTEAHVPGLASS